MNRSFLLISLLALSVSLSACTALPTKVDSKENKPTEEQNKIIQLSPTAIRLSNISSFNVESRPADASLSTVGVIRANENQVYHLSSFTAGRLVQDKVKLGDAIHAGQVVAAVQNIDLLKADADYIHQLHQNELDVRQAKTRWLLAQKNLKREKSLVAEGISPQKDYYQAETEATLATSSLEGQKEHQTHIRREAKAMLGAYGVAPTSPQSENIQSASPIRSPRAGVISQKNVVLGDMITPDKILYEVIDLSQVWLDITVYPKDVAAIRMGQTVQFSSDSLPGKTFLGQINYIPPSASAGTQTFIARAYINNPSGSLKPGMAGKVKIQQPQGLPQPFIPESALQTFGKETFVFLDLGNGKYIKTPIQTGLTVSGGYLINSGLRVGDRVVGKGSFNLKAEMLKSQFGEGE